jgi:hypothetical protein
MGRISSHVAVALTSLTLLAAAGCTGGPEQPILNQYFTASRLRDNTTLANFSTVAFEPREQGTVTSFTIQSVSPEQHKALAVRTLVDAQAAAKAADADYTKRKDAYETANLDAIKRVIDAENASKPVKGKDAEVQAAWTKLRQEGAEVSKRVYDARRRFASETSVASLSVQDPRAPVDLAKYDVDLVSKEATIAARVNLPTGQAADKTLVVTMQRAVLKGDREITGRWVITGIRDASASPATQHS